MISAPGYPVQNDIPARSGMVFLSNRSSPPTWAVVCCGWSVSDFRGRCTSAPYRKPAYLKKQFRALARAGISYAVHIVGVDVACSMIPFSSNTVSKPTGNQPDTHLYSNDLASPGSCTPCQYTGLFIGVLRT